MEYPEFLQTYAALCPIFLVCAAYWTYWASVIFVTATLLHGKVRWAREERKRGEAWQKRRFGLYTRRITRIQTMFSLFQEFVRWSFLILTSFGAGLLWPFAPTKMYSKIRDAFQEIGFLELKRPEKKALKIRDAPLEIVRD